MRVGTTIVGICLLMIFSIYGTAFAVAPDPPTSLNVTPFSSSQNNLSWVAPLNDGGSSITGYKIEQRVDNATVEKIVFYSDQDGGSQIFIMNSDGTSRVNLSNSFFDDYSPVLSPDGTKIAFNRDNSGTFEIWSMNVDGTNQMQLTTSDDYSPSWNPDGTKIAFTSFRDGNEEIYTMNSDGTNQTNISNNSAADGLASWSPDGTKIAFTTNRDVNDEIYTMNSDGTNQTNISNNVDDDFYPSWSPDGTKIAFTRVPPSIGDTQIYIMNADGTNQTLISSAYPLFRNSFSTLPQDNSPIDLTFNPDGTTMLLLGTEFFNIYEYTLSTAFDVTTASYSGNSFPADNQDNTPNDLSFNTDGTRMLILGEEFAEVYEYTLSTAFDVTTASYSGNSFSVDNEDSFPQGFTFSPDGTKMYVLGVEFDRVYEYTLSTAFDVTTASYSGNFLSIVEDGEPNDVGISSDGTSVFVVGSVNDEVYQYTLTTPFDVSTDDVQFSFSVGQEDDFPYGIAFSDNGNKIFVVGSEFSSVYQYTLPQPFTLNANPMGFDVADLTPSWSPDGTQITIDRQFSGGPPIYTMNTDGTEQTNISLTGDNDFDPDWGAIPNWILLNNDTGTTSTTYSDTMLDEGTLYDYRVSANNIDGTSLPSNESGATTTNVLSEGTPEDFVVETGGTGSFSYSETEGGTTETISLDVTLPTGQAGTITVSTAVEDDLESGTILVTGADITGPCTGTCTIQFTILNSLLTAVGLTPETASIYHDLDEDGFIEANEAIPTTRDTTTIPGSTIFTGTADFTSFFGVGKSLSGGGGGDKTPPSFTKTFDETEFPLSINGNNYSLDDLNDVTPITVETGKSMKIQIQMYDNGGAQNIQHVTLYVNQHGDRILNDLTETGITFEKGSDVKVSDPYELIESGTVTPSTQKNKAVFDFEVIFSKDMDISDLLFRIWDSKRNSVNLHVPESLIVIPAEPTSEILDDNILDPEPISDEIQMDPEPIFSWNKFNQWAGYSNTSASDEEFLDSIGIIGKDIPNWIKHNNAKWVKDGTHTQEEFVAVLNYLKSQGII